MSGFDVLGPIDPRGPANPGKKLQPFGIEIPQGKENLLERAGGETPGSKESFIGDLNDALTEIRGLQLESREKARALASGEPIEVHDLMISMGKSEVAFSLMLEVRNKLLEAWNILQRSVS